MAQYYKVVSQNASPLSLADAKLYLKITSSADDALIQSIIDACTEWGEAYTGRDFRVKTYQMLADYFFNSICIIKDPVASITSIQHLVGGVLTAVDPSVYYLKIYQAGADILLNDGKEWPTDTDAREQAIQIDFSTAGYYRQAEILQCLKRHVAYMYFNRGDCSDCGKAAENDGVIFLYNSFRIPRIC